LGNWVAACSNAAIAEGIVRRVYDYLFSYGSDDGLAAALLKALDTPKPCAGLAALSEQTRRELRETSEHQEQESKPN
jgi:hypothetical protein